MSHATALVGYGRFGRALGELLADAGEELRAWDPAADVPEALRAGSLAALVRGAERVVLCVPVARLEEVVTALAPHLDPSQLVLDVASVKHLPVRVLSRRLGSGVPWAATHPLFGPTSIALGERPLLTVVCPNPLRPEATQAARRFWERLGCRVTELDPEEHDRIMASTHALAFFVAKGLLDAGAGGDAVPFAPPSFQAMARTIEAVRSDASHLFRTIQNDNPFAAEARERLLAALQSIHHELASDVALDRATQEIPDLGERAPDLRETRDLIDDTDRELVRLLARRAQLARRAGRAKAREGRPVRDPQRERELRAARRSWAEEEGLDPESIDDLFLRILRHSRSTQRDEGSPEGPPES